MTRDADPYDAVVTLECAYVCRNGRPCLNSPVPASDRCGLHGGRRTIPRTNRRGGAPPCRCAAYAWPHRRRSGFCRYPGPPRFRCLTRPSTHREPSGWKRRGSFAAHLLDFYLGPLPRWWQAPRR